MVSFPWSGHMEDLFTNTVTIVDQENFGVKNAVKQNFEEF